jgi:hypothetical protein
MKTKNADPPIDSAEELSHTCSRCFSVSDVVRRRLPRCLGTFLLLLLMLTGVVWEGFAGCDGFGGSGGGCSGGSGVSGAVVIPSTFNGLPVTRIAPGAFQGNDAITSVTIPDTVTNIGASAFASCRSLASVTMGNGITQIEPRAFEWCLSLPSITFSTNCQQRAENAVILAV